MSERTPELRTMTANRVRAVVPTANVVENLTDPVKAASIVAETKTTLVAIAFSRVERKLISSAAMFRAAGTLDVAICALSPEVLDETVLAVHAALLTDLAWVSEFEAIDSLVTDYEYVAAGNVDLALAYVRITCIWAETYTPTLADLESVHITTRVGTVRGGATVMADVVDETEIALDEPVFEVQSESVMLDEDWPLESVISRDSAELEAGEVPRGGPPVHEPTQELTA
ncbi:hypothetical protein ACW73L_07475 [Methylolobus aquaticus]